MKLLLCEDEKDLSKALVTMLKHNSYIVDAVFDGQDALDFIDSNDYDGIILDIMMPKVDGLTVLKTIRANGNKTPVIMLTAKSEVDDKCLGLDLGADDYLTKPFSMKELISRIHALVRRTGEISKDVLTLGNISLSRETYELTTESDSIKLVNREYQMLELMMKSPKKIISVETFLDKAWGLDSEAEINTVWVYISYLRRKLESVKANVEIKSSRNVGYYLEIIDDKKTT